MSQLLSASALLLFVTATTLGNVVSLPAHFSGTQGTGGIYYEAIGDSRSTNILHPGAGVTSMEFNPAFVFSGDTARPTYRVPQSFPFIQNHIGGDYLLMHPGTGGANFGTGTSNIGASVRFQAAADGWYNANGTFAWQNGLSGNGVDVLVAKQDDIDTPLFATTISIAPVPPDPFAGAAIAPFNLNVYLAAGESLRFIVFADAQGQDGTYDGTALRLSIQEVPEPSSYILGVIALSSLLAIRLRR